MSAAPRVSVIVPNYNHRPFLSERLESIFQQTYTDFELILLDDASADGSLELLRSYASRPGVRLLINEVNSGSPFHQWNRGMQDAHGEYVWIAESDDTARQEFLERLVTVLDAHPSVGLAECESQLIDGSGTVLGPIPRDAHPEAAQRWRHDFLAEGREEIRRFLYLQNTIPSSSAVVFRRSAYRDAGPADPELTLTGDWLQWVKLLLRSDRYFLAQPLSFSRVHSGTQREAAARNGRQELEALAVQRRIQRLLPIDPPMTRRGAERYATSWLQSVRTGRYSGPLGGHAACFWRLLRNDPLVAFGFAARLPYGVAVWFLKRTLFRHRQHESRRPMTGSS